MKLNADFTQRIAIDTETEPWVASPLPGVERRMLDRIGDEVARATTIVRYAPNSYFSPHTHSGGEEFLVLEGVFSDEHGDWPAGTYLLNPEGFRHAPFSKDGCLLFVKLRQFPGRDRQHVVIDTAELEWQPGAAPGIDLKPLYAQAGYSDTMRLERWQPGTDPGVVSYEHGVELFVLEGTFSDDEGDYAEGSWLRLPGGASHHPRSTQGCTLYLKHAGFHYLRSAV